MPSRKDGLVTQRYAVVCVDQLDCFSTPETFHTIDWSTSTRATSMLSSGWTASSQFIAGAVPPQYPYVYPRLQLQLQDLLIRAEKHCMVFDYYRLHHHRVDGHAGGFGYAAIVGQCIVQQSFLRVHCLLYLGPTAGPLCCGLDAARFDCVQL